jgi:hypothetical protein
VLLTGDAHDERCRLDGVPVVPSFQRLNAALLFTACEEIGVEGLVVKRGGSLHWPGQPTLDWRTVKIAAWWSTWTVASPADHRDGHGPRRGRQRRACRLRRPTGP